MPAVLREPASGEVFQLEDFTLIGRSEGVTVRLGDSSISRQHATIRREGVNYWLADLGSANGSYVNEVALTSARMLSNGDRIQFHAELTAVMMHRWVVRGAHRFELPGAQPGRDHLGGRLIWDMHLKRWLAEFLDMIFSHPATN